MSDYINQDLLDLILKRLPAKDLLRFRSVSKSWKKVIDSTAFIVDHLAVQTPGLIAHNHPCDLNYLAIDPHALPLFNTLEAPIELKSEKKRYVVVSSIHGVICLYQKANIVLLNPWIRRITRLPPPEFPARHSSDYFHYCSFWIDPSNNHFKVVIFCFKSKTLALFSSGNQAWKEAEMAGVDHYLEDGRCRQVMINGVAHWLAYNWYTARLFIVYFDFMEEKLGSIDLPDKSTKRDWRGELRVKGYHSNLCKWKEFLSVVSWQPISPYTCNLWVMQNGSWSKMLNCKLGQGMMDVLFVGERKDRVLAQTDRGHLVLHDVKDGSIYLKLRFKGCSGFYVAYDFVESLVFPEQKSVSGD